MIAAACGGDDLDGAILTAEESPSGVATATDVSPAAAASQTDVGDGVVSLIAGGDVMLGRSLGDGILQFGTPYPFEFVAGLLSAADIAFANLEAPVSNRGEPANKDFVFRAPPEAAVSLSNAGIDIV